MRVFNCVRVLIAVFVNLFRTVLFARTVARNARADQMPQLRCDFITAGVRVRKGGQNTQVPQPMASTVVCDRPERGHPTSPSGQSKPGSLESSLVEAAHAFLPTTKVNGVGWLILPPIRCPVAAEPDVNVGTGGKSSFGVAPTLAATNGTPLAPPALLQRRRDLREGLRRHKLCR